MAKAPSSKVIARKSPSKTAAPRAISVPDRQHASVSVRKIDNGYIISESCEGPKGYEHNERYSATKPKIVMPSAVITKGGK